MLLSSHLKLQFYGKQLAEQVAHNIATMDTGQYLPKAHREAMAATIKCEIDENEFRIVGGQYVWTYEIGRGPTVNPGTGAVRRYVRDYIEETGMQPKGQDKNGMPIDENTLAFFISRRIHESGSKPWRTKQPTGVISSVINDTALEQLSGLITEAYTAEIAGFLLNTANK